jgi:hypothetical protein
MQPPGNPASLTAQHRPLQGRKWGALMTEYLPLFMFLSTAVIAVFTMISIAVWTGTRLAEREAYYRNEVLKKLAEMQGAGAESVLNVMREEERRAERQKIEGLKIGGLAATAAGVAIAGFLWNLEKVRMVGFIPLLVGLALLVYAFLLAPGRNR